MPYFSHQSFCHEFKEMVDTATISIVCLSLATQEWGISRKQFQIEPTNVSVQGGKQSENRLFQLTNWK